MSFTVTDLPRGGRLVQWDDFTLQIGAYPETIKDTISEGVPGLFLVADQMFDVTQGVSSAELEFPVYYNFYCKSRKTRFLCRRHQLRPVLRVLREAAFGPSTLKLEDDFVDGARTPAIPNMMREMAWFKVDPKRPRGRLQLADMVEPMVFDEQLRASIDGVLIEALGGNRFRFSRDGQSHEVHCESEKLPAIQEPSNYYRPPTFGVTIIGSGHGFDAKTNTSGFLIWINGKGVLVDPPVHSTRWLKEQHIDTRICQDVILTHCHADHDSGTLQKVLEESRITLHSTETVLSSFIRKYRSLTELTRAQFCRLFDFRPVLVGDCVNIAGAEFRFYYTLHPIPTLGFSVSYQGKTFAYSCDTLYDPEVFQQLEEEGIFSAERHQDLLKFRWDADLILHEAGVPPIHTPMSVLAGMSDDIKQRLYLTHVSVQAIPPNSGLRLAPPGAPSTLVLDVPLPAESQLAHRILDLMAHVDLFADMKLGRALEFLEIAHYSQHPAGQTIVRQGESGDRFYMVLAGELAVVVDGTIRKAVSRYDYFGEIAVVMNQPRVADVVSQTDVELLSISRRDFMQFIQGSHVLTTLRRVAKHKIQGSSWDLFAANRLLRNLTTYQKTQFLALMSPAAFAQSSILFQAGEEVTTYYLLDQGQVEIRDTQADTVEKLGLGCLLGQLSEGDEQRHYRCSAKALTDVTAYVISSAEFARFMAANPGTMVRLLGATRMGNRAYVL